MLHIWNFLNKRHLSLARQYHYKCLASIPIITIILFLNSVAFCESCSCINNMTDETAHLTETQLHQIMNSDNRDDLAKKKFCDQWCEYAANNRLSVIKNLIAKGMDVNATSSRDAPAIFYAAANDSLEVLQHFIQHPDVKLEGLYEYKYPLLMTTLEFGLKDDCAALLIACNKVNINAKNTHNFFSPLMQIVKVKKHNLLKQIVLRSDLDINLQDLYGNTALKIAIEADDPVSIEILLNHTRLDFAMPQHAISDLLNTAICLHRHQSAKYLIKYCQDKNIKIDEQLSLLPAIVKKNHEILNILLTLDRIDVNYQDNKTMQTALHMATRQEDLVSIRALLKHPQIDVNHHDNRTMQTALHMATRQRDCATIIALLKHPKIDVNHQDNRTMETALHIATRQGDCESITALLKHPKIDLYIENAEKQTPIYLANTHSNPEKLVPIFLEFLNKNHSMKSEAVNELVPPKHKVKIKPPALPLNQISPLQEEKPKEKSLLRQWFAFLYKSKKSQVAPENLQQPSSLNADDVEEFTTPRNTNALLTTTPSTRGSVCSNRTFQKKTYDDKSSSSHRLMTRIDNTDIYEPRDSKLKKEIWDAEMVNDRFITQLHNEL